MKRFTFATILFLLISFTYSCNENTTKSNDLKKMGFHGDIATIIETEYELDSKFGEEQIGEIRKKTIFKFNNDGNKTEEILYCSGRDLDWKYKYTYNEKDNKIEEKSYNVNNVLEESTKLIKYEITYR